MPKVHIKGLILQLLERQPELWDFDIAKIVVEEYQFADLGYWVGAVRVNLAELDAGGLVQQVGEQIAQATGKLHYRYRLTAFGAQRMRDTGLAVVTQ